MSLRKEENMVNQVMLVGRLTKDPEVTTMEKGKKVSHIVVAVPRSFKNTDGVYDTDFIRCTLWNAIAASTSEYCHKGDVIGVRGRIQVSSYTDENNNTKYTTEVIADKITFLSKQAK